MSEPSGFLEKTVIGKTQSGPHNIAYQDWGQPGNPPVFCVHGLTGNSFDFDFLAADLVRHGYRVISITLVGRGKSDFLNDPMDYNYSHYIKDIFAVLDAENLNTPNSLDWIGISLGGLLGMHIAAMENSPIQRLILNDIGPVVPEAALNFIHEVIKVPYHFENLDALELRMRQTRGLSWGPVTDEQWTHMAQHNHRLLDDGNYSYAYDPRIAVVFEHAPIGDVDLWEVWNAISCPILLIHGKKSLLLTKKIIKAMRKTDTDFDLLTLKKCGHAPSLMAPDQILAITEWLEKTHH
ncbi:MAG: alpha/beta fold hydrolase [Bdellovibrionales bacterium]